MRRLLMRLPGRSNGGAEAGGGFAGTTQLYIPEENFKPFRHKIETVFGKGSLTELQLRSEVVVTL